MEDLFLIFFLLFFVSTIVIFIKPNKFLKNKTDSEIKKTRIALIILTIVFFILFGISNDASKKKTSTVQMVSKQTQNIEAKKSVSPVVNKTAQQILEEGLSSIVNSVGSDMEYRGLQVEKSDPDRPQDAKMITVSVNVKSFWDKASLLRNTGKLSSSLFKAIYDAPSLKAFDVFVRYLGDTTDRYGNKKNDAILIYAIDKTTYDKMNWQNFDQSDLCNFLKQEAKITDTFNTACNTLVNLQ